MGRLRGCIWLTAGLIVAILAGAVAFITVERASTLRTSETTTGPQVEVVVATEAIAVRSQLSPEMLQLRKLPVESVPEGALRDIDQATDRITLVELYPGEVVLRQRLLDPNVTSADGRMALVVAEDEVLMAFPVEDLMSQIHMLKPGDRVDLLFSLDFPVNRGIESLTSQTETGTTEAVVSPTGQEDEQATFNLLQNVTVAAIVSNTPSATTEEGAVGTTAVRTARQNTGPEAILFTVSPQDALLLKYAKDAGGQVDIVLRAPGVEQPFETDPVDVDYMIYRYRIPTDVGR